MPIFQKLFAIITIIFILISCDSKKKNTPTNTSTKKSSSIKGLNVFSENTKNIISINISTILSHPEVNNILSKDKKFQDVKKQASEVGVDLLKDVKLMIIGLPDIQTNFEKSPSTIYFELHQKDQDAIIKKLKLEFIKQKRVKVDQKEVSGFKVLHIKTNKGFSDIIFLNNETIVFSANQNIQQVIDLYNGKGKSIESNLKMINHIKKLRKNNFIWGLFNINDTAKQLLVAKGNFQKEVADQINNLTIESNINNNNLSLVLSIITGQDKVAQSIVGILNMYKGFLKNFNQELVNKINIKDNNKIAQISINLTADEIKKLASKKKK